MSEKEINSLNNKINNLKEELLDTLKNLDESNKKLEINDI